MAAACTSDPRAPPGPWCAPGPTRSRTPQGACPRAGPRVHLPGAARMGLVHDTRSARPCGGQAGRGARPSSGGGGGPAQHRPVCPGPGQWVRSCLACPRAAGCASSAGATGAQPHAARWIDAHRRSLHAPVDGAVALVWQMSRAAAGQGARRLEPEQSRQDHGGGVLPARQGSPHRLHPDQVGGGGSAYPRLGAAVRAVRGRVGEHGDQLPEMDIAVIELPRAGQ